jgi:hypothetical protein
LTLSSKDPRGKPKGDAEKLKLGEQKAEMGLGDYGLQDHGGKAETLKVES